LHHGKSIGLRKGTFAAFAVLLAVLIVGSITSASMQRADAVQPIRGVNEIGHEDIRGLPVDESFWDDEATERFLRRAEAVGIDVNPPGYILGISLAFPIDAFQV